MKLQFIEYPTCSTCKKAKKYLQQAGVSFVSRHIVEDTPSAEELKQWHQNSNIALKKFFNTSGNLYKERHLKDIVPLMSEEDQYQLLASNGMLIKRPLLIYGDLVLIGFQEDNYEKLCSEC